jgi:hypothetical protein
MPENTLGQAIGVRNGAELLFGQHQEPGGGGKLFAGRAMGIGRGRQRQPERAGDPAVIMDEPDQSRSGIPGDSMGAIFRCDTQLPRSCPRHARGRGRLLRPLHLPRPEHSKDVRLSQIQPPSRQER